MSVRSGGGSDGSGLTTSTDPGRLIGGWSASGVSFVGDLATNSERRVGTVAGVTFSTTLNAGRRSTVVGSE